MSEHTSVYGNGVLACAHGLVDLNYEPSAMRFVACHDACLGIEDPETTVPKLMAAASELVTASREESCFYSSKRRWDAMQRLRNVVANATGEHRERKDVNDE